MIDKRLTRVPYGSPPATRLSRDRYGEPVLTVKVSGTHAVERMHYMLERGPCEFADLARRLVASWTRQRGRPGEPVLTVKVSGPYDVYRMHYMLVRGSCRLSADLARRIHRSWRRQRGGKSWQYLDDYAHCRLPWTRGAREEASGGGAA